MNKIIVISIEGAESNTEKAFFEELFQPLKDLCVFFATEPDKDKAFLRIDKFIKSTLSETYMLNTYLKDFESILFFIYDDDKHTLNWNNQQLIINKTKTSINSSKLIKSKNIFNLCVKNHKFDEVIYGIFTKTKLEELNQTSVSTFIKKYRIKSNTEKGNNKLWKFIDDHTNDMLHYELDDLYLYVTYLLNEFKDYIPSSFKNFFNVLLDLIIKKIECL